jgi:probable F420-dependent oxidoreductase
MLIDTTLGDLESAAAAAAAAEEAGYDGIFTGELSNDPFLPLALAAGATDRIDIGTSIAVAFSRSPMSVAYTAHDLQRFSHGRLVLGLGSQVKAHITRRFSMPWGRPAAQMREFVLAMRAAWQCWSGGRAARVRGRVLPEHPHAPEFCACPPPIRTAAGLRRRGRRWDDAYRGRSCRRLSLPRLHHRAMDPGAHRPRAGRGTSPGRQIDGGVHHQGGHLPATGTGTDIEAEVATIRSHLAFYASTPAYRPVLDLHGWGDLGQDLTRLSKEGRWAEMPELIDDEVLHAFAIVAPLEEVPDRLVKRGAGVVDRVSFISSVEHASLVDVVG